MNGRQMQGAQTHGEQTHRVLVSIGSNIDKGKNVPAAVELLRAQPGFQVLAVSPVWETEALDKQGQPSGQPAFHNAALLAETTLAPAQVRALLRSVEAALGRVRTADKFAARTIDLDLAAYDDAVLEIEGKHIPDPGILRYLYIAAPLAAVAPDWMHPQTGQTLAEIARALEAHTG